MISPRFIVGFTGHRNLPDEEIVIAALNRVLIQLHKGAKKCGGTLELYSSLAYGADLIALDQAERIGLPAHVILPKPVETPDEVDALPVTQGFAADFWKDGTFLRDEWTETLHRIQEATKGVRGGSLRLVIGTHTSPECYYDTGVQIVDASDVVIAIWNGKDAKGLGGTGDVVELARIRKLPLIIIDPITGVDTTERLDSFANPKDADIQLLSTLESYVIKHHPHLKKGSNEAVHFPVTVTQANTLLSETAGSMANRFRGTLVKIIWGHGLATAVAAIASVIAAARDFTHLAWMLAALALVEVILVFDAKRRQRSLGKSSVHDAWMQCRFAAEIMRTQRLAGRLLDPLSPLIARHNPEWRRLSLSAALDYYERTDSNLNWNQQRDNYVKGRLQEQIDYFTAKQANSARLFKRAGWWANTLGSAAVAFVFGALIFKVLRALDLIPLEFASGIGVVIAFTLLPILLPLSVNLSLSLRKALDVSRRTVRYDEISGRLKEAVVLIQSLKTASSVRRAVSATEEVLIDELNEWHLSERQNQPK